jgi:hypothetical protein
VTRNERKSGLLVAELAAGRTVAEACRRAQVSEATARRWLQEPGFREEIRTVRAALLERAVGQLADATAEAVTTLRELLGAESETARLGAARAILDGTLKGLDVVDIQVRLAALEARAAAEATPPRRGSWTGSAG